MESPTPITQIKSSEKTYESKSLKTLPRLEEPEKEIVHRNSVSSRESLSNLSKKASAGNLKKTEGSSSNHVLSRGYTAPGGFNKKTNNSDTFKNSMLWQKVYSGSIAEIKEEDSNAASDSPHSQKKSSLSKEGTSQLKAKFLSFSKRIKGSINSISGQSAMDLSNKKSPSVDVRVKNNSNVKLTTLSNGVAPPSASAYDISEKAVQKPKGLDDYYIIRRVGKGGFATVFLVRLKASTGRYFALKAIKKSEVVRLKQEKQIMNEKNILMELKHPLLVDLYHTFQSPSNLFMIMEFVAGGDLFTLLRKSKMFSEPQAKFYVCEVLTVLEYLHSVKVVYRDLKPENILLDSTGHIKLADFGFAKRLSGTTSSFCGTPDYIAAEIVASKSYSFPVDWWSLGVLIFELISGKTPFRADDSEGIYTNIQHGKIQWVPEVTGPIKTVVAGLLEQDPRKRLGTKGAEEIKKAEWFQGVPWEKIGHRGVNPPVIPPFMTPETLEMEKVTKGVQSDYRDILGDQHTLGKFGDPFDGVFKGF